MDEASRNKKKDKYGKIMWSLILKNSYFIWFFTRLFVTLR